MSNKIMLVTLALGATLAFAGSAAADKMIVVPFPRQRAGGRSIFSIPARPAGTPDLDSRG